MKAVVFGGTGAVGKELVFQLLASEKWAKVVTVGRRAVDVPPSLSEQSSKLEQRVIDMDVMQDAASDACKDAHTVFCALGTTRKVAGSAENFKKVDYEYVNASAELAKQSGVPHYSLVTAEGSNANMWAPDFVLFHPLLYAKTKGRAEEAVKAKGFDVSSIFRPGLLYRGEATRGLEKSLSKIFNGIQVSDVARVMIADAERVHADLASGARKGSFMFSMKDLKNAASTNPARAP